MGKRVLVLNVRLAGGFKHLFGHLEKLGWTMRLVTISVPTQYRLWYAMKTFRLPKSRWSRCFYDELDRFITSPRGFRQRTRFCERVIKQAAGKYDLIFQIGGQFAPSLQPIEQPYVTFHDYTTKLAEKNYPEWVPFRSDAEASEWYRLEGQVYANASRVFTASDNTRRSIINDYGTDPKKVHSVGEGLNLEAVPELSDKTYDGKTILFIGKDFERKGGFVLLEAFRIMRSRIRDVQLIIVGQDQVRLNLEGVEWVGWVPNRAAIQQLYRQSSLFVMPSLCEPFGLVFLEAMAHKLPCVGTATDAMPEIIEDGKTGLLAKVGDPVDLADKIYTLLADKNLMRSMGEEGYRQLRNRFTWDRVATRIHNELLEVLHERVG